MQTRRTRFLPKALSAEIRRLPWRLFGLSLIVASGACWLALASWSYVDPSLNYATESRPRNWLGYKGAAVADGLFQAFGLAAPLLIFPLAVLGLLIALGILPRRPRLRFFFWGAAAIALPSFFGSLPAMARWPLDHGLGGLIGDIAVARFVAIGGSLPAALLWTISGLPFGILGLWCLAKACGIGGHEFSLLFAWGAAKSTSLPSFDEPLISPKTMQPLSRRVTSWTKGFSPRFGSLAASPKSPREFWMPPKGRPEPAEPRTRSQNFAVNKPAAEERERARTASSSHFTNWGSRSAKFAVDDIAKLQSETGQKSSDDDDIFDDDRIEPFFGPRHANRSAARDDRDASPDSDPTFAPLKRLTGRATQAAHNGAQRLLKNLSHRSQGRGDENQTNTEARSFGRTEQAEAVDFNSMLPPMSLLAPPQRASTTLNPEDPGLMQRAAMLMEVLGDFGVKGRISGIYPGPVITLFELEPARGTKSSRVVGLADDIARSMSAVSARVAVVPGRDAIGIELPNAKREMVALRAILDAPAFQLSQAALPLALGKSIGGEPIVVDLARMPHLLIAGTTGSGKSVGINTMILSLLYRMPAGQCNFIMIDPKMLELSVYDGIPHLLAPVVTDPKKAVAALKWTVKEMNSRYERMCKLGVRNITSYNAKVAAATLRGQPLRRVIQTGFDPRTDEPLEEEETFDPVSMPYIVVVIDEMADLMMVAGKEIEFAVQRLSQMARAAGIHLIMATQRPSVDVVTGTIKANFPSRISFQVTSKIDSRTIIGEQGAEQLLGAGDMLYMASGGRIIRAHGPFVSDDEVESVARYLKAQGFPTYRDDILEDSDESDEAGETKEERGGDLYAQAVEIVLKDRKPTTSYLQRRLGIGYNRAASLIERMEEEGIIGSPNRTGRREILSDA